MIFGNGSENDAEISERKKYKICDNSTKKGNICRFYFAEQKMWIFTKKWKFSQFPAKYLFFF